MEGDGARAGIERREKDKGNEREKISLYIFWGENTVGFSAGDDVIKIGFVILTKISV